jgi:hypothetical protein
MKDYLVGILILAAVLGLLVMGAVKQVSKGYQAKVELAQSVDELNKSNASSDNKGKQLVAQFGNAGLEKFRRDNSTSLKVMLDSTALNQRIAAECEALHIDVQSQNLAMTLVKGRPNTSLSNVQASECTVMMTCSFKDSLAWLGKIEDDFPYSRVESVTFSPSGDDIDYQVKILFPRLEIAAQ